LIISNVKLTQGFVGLKRSEKLINTLISQLVADQRKYLDFAIMEGQYFLQVECALVVDVAIVERQFLQSAIF
jgi:hypothetical protein